MRLERVIHLLCVWLALFAAGQARAQSQARPFPSHPIRIVEAYGAGGQGDVIARLMAPILADKLGQAVFVENKPGARAQLAADAVATSQPDGCTLLITAGAGVMTLSGKGKQAGYEVQSRLTPVAIVGTASFLLTAPGDAPYKNMAEFLAYAKTKQDKLFYGTQGYGSQAHIVMELLKLSTGMRADFVNFKSIGDLTTANMAGQIQVAIESVGPNVQNIRAGKIKALAVTGTVRSPALPEVGTVADVVPGFRAEFYSGLFAPAATPQDVLSTLHGEVAAAIRAPAVMERLEMYGMQPGDKMSRDQVARRLAEDAALFTRGLRETDIDIE